METPLHIKDQIEARLRDVLTMALDGSGWNLGVLLVVSGERHAVIAGVNAPQCGELTEGWLALANRLARETAGLVR